MKKPNFIIGGATRSGITGLLHIIDHHPQIFIPHRKEHRFFLQSELPEVGLESCKHAFEDAVNVEYKARIPKDRVLQGEKEFNPERAHQVCPNAKIIFSLRNPVERAYVQFYHALEDKKETVRTFEHAMEAELSGLRSPDTTGKCWIYKNQIQTHIEHWLSFYKRENILLMIYEEWTDPANNGLKPLEEFLGLEVGSILEDEDNEFDAKQSLIGIKEQSPKKMPILSEVTKEQLEEIFSVDKTYIQNLLGREIPSWSRY